MHRPDRRWKLPFLRGDPPNPENVHAETVHNSVPNIQSRRDSVENSCVGFQQENRGRSGPPLRRPPSITAIYRGRNESISQSRSSSCTRDTPQANDNRRHGVYIAIPPYTPRQHSTGACDGGMPDTTPATPAVNLQSSRTRVRGNRPRRTRQPTFRPETENSDDPPPRYSVRDTDPFFGEDSARSMSMSHIVDRVRQIGLKHTTEKVGRSVVKGMEDVGKAAKDMPKAAKEAQAHLRIKRAKGKIRWLEKYNFLSGQDRLLGQELRGR